MRWRFKAFGHVDATEADYATVGVEAPDGLSWELRGLVTAPDEEEAFALVYEQVSEYGFAYKTDGVDLSDPLAEEA